MKRSVAPGETFRFLADADLWGMTAGDGVSVPSSSFLTGRNVKIGKNEETLRRFFSRMHSVYINKERK